MENDFDRNHESKKATFLLLSKTFKHLALSAILVFATLLVLFAFNFSNKTQACGTESPIDFICYSSNVPVEFEESYFHGEALFKANCAACHAIGRKLTGPDLSGINQEREREWLYAWIRNNNALRESGDVEAIKIYEDYNEQPMNLFLHFTDTDIDNILTYIDIKGG